MASNFLRKPGLPLQDLANYFQRVKTREGILSLPDLTLESIKQHRDQDLKHSEREIDALVGTLESSSPQLCLRIDARGLIVLCSVLIHSHTCLAQQRGLCLVKEALYASRDGEAKAIVGSEALLPLIKGFLKSDNSDETRRWMGVVALELLSFCPANITILKKDYPQMESLGTVVKTEQTHMLKLLAGLMINVIFNRGRFPLVIWIDTIQKILSSRFPTSQADSPRVDELNELAMELDSDNNLAQQSANTFFACALAIGSTRYSVNEESAILVTVPNDINIIIPDLATTPAMYIDIPVDNIRSATVQGQRNSQSQSLFYVLTITLFSSTGCTHYTNATARSDRSVLLVFASESDANTLGVLLHHLGNDREASPDNIVLEEDAEMAGTGPAKEGTHHEDGGMADHTKSDNGVSGRISISQGIAVSQPFLVDESGNQMTQANQGFLQNATLSIPQGHAPATNQSGFSAPATSHRQSAPNVPRMSQAIANEQGLSHRTSIAFGVDVSQTDGDDVQIDVGSDAQSSDTSARRCIDQTPSYPAKADQQLHTSLVENMPPHSLPKCVQTPNNSAENDVYMEINNTTNHPSELPITDTNEAMMHIPKPDLSAAHQNPPPQDPPTTTLKQDMGIGDGDGGRSSALMDRTLSTNVGSKSKAKRQKVNKARVSPYPDVKADSNHLDEYEIQASTEDASDAHQLQSSKRKKRMMERNTRDMETETDKKTRRGLGPLPKSKATKPKRAVPSDSKTGVMPNVTSTNGMSTKSESNGPLEPRSEPRSMVDETKEKSARSTKSNVKATSPKRKGPVALPRPRKAAKAESTGVVKDQVGRVEKAEKAPETVVRRKPTTKAKDASETVQQPEPTPEPATVVSSATKPKREAAQKAITFLHGLLQQNKTTNIGQQVKNASAAVLEKIIEADDPSGPPTGSDGQTSKTPKSKNKNVGRAAVSQATSQKHSTGKSSKEASLDHPPGTKLETLRAMTLVSDLGNDESDEFAPTLDPQVTEDIARAKVASKGPSTKFATKTSKLPVAQSKGRSRRPAEGTSVKSPGAATGQRAEAEANPTINRKRKADTQDSLPPKRAKRTSATTHDVDTSAKGTEGASVKTPLPPANKKPVIIGWDASGPRNQGTVSSRKSQSNDINTDTNGKDVAQIQYTTEEEAILELEDSASGGLHLCDTATPPPSRMHEPQMITEPASFAKQEKAQRLSSQSMKVDMNGSPLPKVQTIVNDQGPTGSSSESQNSIKQVRKVADGSDGGSHRDGVVRTTSNTNSVDSVIIVNGRRYVLQETLDRDGQPIEKVSNGKQVPNPPKASSSVELSPRHEILDNGELLNPQTSERIAPSQPLPNPFISQGGMSTSSFIKTLRKDIRGYAESANGDSNADRSSGNKKRKSCGDEEEDPSVTLVELEAKQKRRKLNHDPSPESSLTSQSTSQDTPPTGEESGNSSQGLSHGEAEIPHAAVRWAETMDPDKTAIFDILCIAALRQVRHLGDRELSSVQALRDYQKNGGALLSRYATERNAIAKTNENHLNRMMTTLKTVYQDAVKGKSEKPVTDMGKPSEATTALEARWNAEATRRTAAIAEAMKACVD